MVLDYQNVESIKSAIEVFGCVEMDTHHSGERLIVFPIRAMAYDRDAASILANAMKSVTHPSVDMNIWVDVQVGPIPRLVQEAIRQCIGADLRLVLTNDDVTSHPPGPTLQSPLVDIIAKASARRAVWHPLARKLVPPLSRP